jgi:plastocyanin
MGGNRPVHNGFEQRIKESLDQFEVPYNSADWAQMDRALSSGMRGWGRGRSIMVGALVAGALLIGGTAYFLGRDTKLATASNPALTMERSDTPVAAVGPGQTQTSLPLPVSVSGAAMDDPGEKATASMPEGHQQKKRSARSRAVRSATVAMTPSGAPEPAPAKSTNAATVFHASAKEACPGTPVKFTVDHMPDDGIYLWNFGDGSFSNKPAPEHTYTKPGSYEVMLSLSSSGAGTIHNKPSSDVIVVHDGPEADFNILQQNAPGTIPSMRFENTSKNAGTYTWNFGDGTISTAALPDHIFKKKGTYHVELTATGTTGCVDRTLKEVHVDRDHDLGAPVSFSPGTGQGAGFMPSALVHLRSKFQLAVYDPAGMIQYSTTDADQPWNGRVHNQGAPCPAGNYVWVVNLDAGQQAAETFTGQVKLER